MVVDRAHRPRARGHRERGQPDPADGRGPGHARPDAPDDPAAGLGGGRRPGARVGVLNALWVGERRIERAGRTATLHTELGSWPLRRGVVPAEVPVREALKGRLRVDGAEVQIAGVLDDLYDATDARLGPTWNGD